MNNIQDILLQLVRDGETLIQKCHDKNALIHSEKPTAEVRKGYEESIIDESTIWRDSCVEQMTQHGLEIEARRFKYFTGSGMAISNYNASIGSVVIRTQERIGVLLNIIESIAQKSQQNLHVQGDYIAGLKVSDNNFDRSNVSFNQATITGEMDKLLSVINNEYSDSDKNEVIQLANEARVLSESDKESDKSEFKKKLGQLLAKTANVAQVASLVIEILASVKG